MSRTNYTSEFRQEAVKMAILCVYQNGVRSLAAVPYCETVEDWKSLIPT